jgi:hypothetical protein
MQFQPASDLDDNTLNSASSSPPLAASSLTAVTSVMDKENKAGNLLLTQKKRKQTTPVPKPDQNKRGKFVDGLLLARSPSPLPSVPEESRYSVARQTIDDLRQRCQTAEEELRRGKELSGRQIEEAKHTLLRAARNMSRILVEGAKREREAARKRMCSEVERLGRYTVVGRM